MGIFGGKGKDKKEAKLKADAKWYADKAKKDAKAKADQQKQAERIRRQHAEDKAQAAKDEVAAARRRREQRNRNQGK